VPTTNVGLVTASVTPSARSAPRTNVVLPAPRSPETSTTSPGRSAEASCAPARSVAAGPPVSLSVLTQAQAQDDAAGQHDGADGQDRRGVETGARKLRGARLRLGLGGGGLGFRRGRLLRGGRGRGRAPGSRAEPPRRARRGGGGGPA